MSQLHYEEDHASNLTKFKKNANILLVTSVEAEQKAILKGLNDNPRFDCLVAGVGAASAAANTAMFLYRKNYDLVINLGIAGGFAEKANIETLVIADNIIAADLGAETEQGFTSMDKLGFGETSIEVDQYLIDLISDVWSRNNISYTVGAILTVNTVTGSSETGLEHLKRRPTAVAEAMEGFGVATAAQIFDIPVLEIRSISNLVGPRNREAWKIKEALMQLEKAASTLTEVL